MTSLEPIHSSTLAQTSPNNELDRLATNISDMLKQLGLPTDNLFKPVNERATVVNNLDGVLTDLSPEIRSQSHYVSKMVAAATVGLFDAALNYLWDELISTLRQRVTNFNLSYFIDTVAGKKEEYRKGLKTEDDLTKVIDSDLLSACLEMGLISDIGFHRLNHIRYMRNNASAAHPNQNDLTGLDLLSFLQSCIREVINTPIETVTASIGQLLSNIKKEQLDTATANSTAAFFSQLSQDQADSLANGLFGIYTATDRTPTSADNIRLLWPRLWPFISDKNRYRFGIRIAQAEAIAESTFAESAHQLINIVNGAAYLVKQTRIIQIDEALNVLETVHREWNNFYNEPIPAQRVLSLVGEKGDVPEPVRDRYIHVIVECFLGNGSGVSVAAEESYDKMLKTFSAEDAGVALRLFMNPVYISLLDSLTGQQQWNKLLDILESKLTNTNDRNLMTAIRSFSGTPDQLHLDSSIKQLATI